MVPHWSQDEIRVQNCCYKAPWVVLGPPASPSASPAAWGSYEDKTASERGREGGIVCVLP